MDLVTDYVVGVRKREKSKLTVDFLGLSHWSNGVATY